MSPVTPNEKADAPGLSVQTVAKPLADKPSQDTLTSEMSSTEKVVTRSSDVSSNSSTAHNANPFDTDIEAIISTNTENRHMSAQCTRGGADCQVWPGQDHWRRKAKLAKRSRQSCKCLSHLSKRNRIIVKVVIGLLIVGIAVGIGFGVSKPLGAGIWHPHNR